VKITWENAKELSTLALYEVAAEGLRNGAHADVDDYLAAHAALFELVSRANAGKVAREELERRRHAA
jgi:hypothetical protein